MTIISPVNPGILTYLRNNIVNSEKIKAITAALASDHHSKAAYTGRIEQRETVTVHAEDGTPIQKEVSFFISWDTIDAILTMVRQRASL